MTANWFTRQLDAAHEWGKTLPNWARREAGLPELTPIEASGWTPADRPPSDPSDLVLTAYHDGYGLCYALGMYRRGMWLNESGQPAFDVQYWRKLPALPKE